MTLGDFLKRVDIEKDKDKMICIDFGDGWSNCSVTNNENEPIYIIPDPSSPHMITHPAMQQRLRALAGRLAGQRNSLLMLTSS